MKRDENPMESSSQASEIPDSEDPSRRRVRSEVYDREFFLSPLLEGYDEFQRGALSTVKARQIDMLEIFPGCRLLEVGFGRGEFLMHCARAGAQVAGVDYADAAVEIGRQTLAGVPGVDLRRADARHLPHAEGTFDRAYSGDTIEHMCRADAIEMLAEMYRVLRPGGFLLVKTTPNTIFVRWVYPLAKLVLRRIDAQGVALLERQLQVMREVHVDEYNPFNLRSAAREAGLVAPLVWVDADIFRSGGHKYSDKFKSSLLLRLVGRVGRMWPFPTLLGNDLYLKCVKPGGPGPS